MKRGIMFRLLVLGAAFSAPVLMGNLGGCSDSQVEQSVLAACTAAPALAGLTVEITTGVAASAVTDSIFAQKVTSDACNSLVSAASAIIAQNGGTGTVTVSTSDPKSLAMGFRRARRGAAPYSVQFRFVNGQLVS